MTMIAPTNPANRDGRFAPSPTGELHLGNLRTALLAWLSARAAGARFLMRIEDLDPDRSIAGVAEQQLSDLRAIGIDWDGPELVQSHQRPAHDAAVAQLVARGVVYACWCTRAEVLGAASAPHENLPDGAYSGNCRALTHDQREAAQASGRTSCLRVCADAVELAFLDEVMGKASSVVDDFVIVRKDGVPAYNLAVVVDDAAAGVGHIVRGDDLALGTP
ncbi:MAG: tRNA glutamyl-Q(34) synthetase GluQRS, partial [Thermoleophilia bacterium]|nr:tRNA glutamyl-Q(34) synthetase GluQRS [Thermoleophilia bacterium]